MREPKRTRRPVLTKLVLAFGLLALACGAEEPPADAQPPTPTGTEEALPEPEAGVEEPDPAPEQIGAPIDAEREGEPDPPVPERDPTEPEAGQTRPGGAAISADYACVDGDPEAGAEHYATLCASCHGARGGGEGPAAAGLNPKPRRHDDGAYMNELSNEHLFTVTKEGGPAVGKSPLMAPWGGTLSDDQIWDVVAFVRSLAEPAYRCP